MDQHIPGSSKSTTKTVPESPIGDIIDASDDEASTSFFNKSSSQKLTRLRQSQKKHHQNTSIRKNILKRSLESTSVSNLTKKPKLPKGAIDDSLYFNEMLQKEFESDDINEKNTDGQSTDNFSVSDVLSNSQLNAFVVNDPFEEISSAKTTNTDIEEFKFTQYCNNTQFMNQLETAISKINQIQKSQPLKNISNTSKTATSTITFKNKTETFDTTFNDALCDLFKSSQYQREVEESFNCEKTYLMANTELQNEFNVTMNESMLKRKNKVEEMLEKTYKTPEVMKKVLQHASESVNLNKDQIEWTDDSFLTNAVFNLSKNESSFGNLMRNALKDNINKTLTQGDLQNQTVLEKDNIDATFIKHGDFFGLPDRVKDLFKAYKGIDKLYDWQHECLNLPAIHQRSNLIYALPTSGGKTLVAEILILREILCRRKNAMFVLPYVAIVQEKVWAMSPFAVALEFMVEEYAAGKGNYPPRHRRRKNSVYICTIEKALGLMNSLIEEGRTDEIGLVVIDELHLLGDGSRGACLETLLTKVKMLKNKIQMVGMSATIGNISELCEFLNADVYSKDFRPVELVEYVKCQNEVALVNKQSSDAQDILLHEKTVNYYKNSEHLNKMDPDHLGGLVMDVIPEASCLIFCKTRQNCENVANLLCKVIDQDLRKHRFKEKHHLKMVLKEEVGTLCKVLSVTIDYGIAYHHSGLTSEERRLIEEAFRHGILSVICCTSTLAAGVNLPAKRVIIRNPYIGREFINLSRYKQMVGRAGRAGFEEKGESIIICTPLELPRVRQLLLSPMDIALSSMNDNNGEGYQNFLLSCVSLKLATNKHDLQKLAGNTLMAVQAQRLGVDVRQATRQAIKQLFKCGALTTKELDIKSVVNHSIAAELESSIATVSQATLCGTQGGPSVKPKIVVNVKNDTPLQISDLGSAAIKGGLDLKRAHTLYEDLLVAQSRLVLLTGLHLMYLVTPYSISEQVKPSKSLLYSLYTNLNDKEVQTAKVLGFTEAVASKLLTNRRITEIPERVMNRFFVTLMLYDLWNEIPVYEVALKYEVNRGLIQNLMTSAATFASNVYHFCGEFDDFWAFSLLLKGMSDRLSHCCVKELIPLMKLPFVKQNRAKQLFKAGYKTLQSVARAEPEKLTQDMDFMSRKLANQLIAAAKMILFEKVENLREEAEDVLDGINLNI